MRPERPLSVATISASLGCTGSPVSAATAAILSYAAMEKSSIGMDDILMVTIPACLIAILVASAVQNHVGKELDQDPEYQRRLREELLKEDDIEHMDEEADENINPRVKWAVLVFLLGVLLVVVFGICPELRPVVKGAPMNMGVTIQIIMMSIAALILIVGKANVIVAVNGYFFLPNYPTEVAAIGFDRTGTTRIGKYVLNHSFQLAGFITTFVSIAIAYLLVVIFY